MQNRSDLLQLAIDTVLTANIHGVPWDTLVEKIALAVRHDDAINYRLSHLKRTPSETPAETISKGQKAIARRYIDAAHRYGRIRYAGERGNRWVYLGTPPSTGGQFARATEWPTATHSDTGSP